MAAKDTVMSIEKIESLFIKTRSTKQIDPSDHQMFMNMLKNLCSLQSEISFKAGMREVVVWVRENSILMHPLLVPSEDTPPEIMIRQDLMIAKLKEWGID